MSGKNRRGATKKKLYVGCSLTYAPKDFVDKIADLKEKLSEDWDIMHFLGVVAGNEVDVYQNDIIDNVGNCDAFLGVVDESSTGLGWEASVACHLSKPSLLVAHLDTRVSRLILGAPHFNPTLTFRRYENMLRDVPRIVKEVLASSIGKPLPSPKDITNGKEEKTAIIVDKRSRDYLMSDQGARRHG
ncbi:MAG: hypothetical protein ACYCPS_04665 [Candidatus Saccharimonadales bacterium]